MNLNLKRFRAPLFGAMALATLMVAGSGTAQAAPAPGGGEPQVRVVYQDGYRRGYERRVVSRVYWSHGHRHVVRRVIYVRPEHRYYRDRRW